MQGINKSEVGLQYGLSGLCKYFTSPPWFFWRTYLSHVLKGCRLDTGHVEPIEGGKFPQIPLY